jgi:hypothetical protein
VSWANENRETGRLEVEWAIGMPEVEDRSSQNGTRGYTAACSRLVIAVRGADCMTAGRIPTHQAGEVIPQ